MQPIYIIVHDWDGWVTVQPTYFTDREEAEFRRDGLAVASDHGSYRVMELAHESLPDIPRPYPPPPEQYTKEYVPPRTITEVDAESVGLDSDAQEPGTRFIRCEWDDTNGYYEVNADGTICCTVFNESEIFTTPEAAQRWLWERLN